MKTVNSSVHSSNSNTNNLDEVGFTNYDDKLKEFRRMSAIVKPLVQDG